MRIGLVPSLVIGVVVTGCTATPDAQPPQDNQSPQAPAVEREVDLTEFFPGIDSGDASFVVLHARTGDIIRYNPARARERFVPASTFKIANALIALETGVASGPDHLIPWDSTPQPGFWSEAWSRDHTLRSAIRVSAYWYFQEIARQVGAERMQAYLDRFDYGNRNMAGGLDQFWLHGELRISPDEQVRFLRRMYEGQLGLTDRTTQIVKDIIVLEETPEYRLSGKTGTALSRGELAWLVGYVDRGGDTWFFALNVEGDRVWEQWGMPAARLELVRTLLQAVGVTP